MKRRDFLKLSASLVTTTAAPVFIGRTRETDLGYLEPGQNLTVQYNLLDDANGEILVKCFLDIGIDEIEPGTKGKASEGGTKRRASEGGRVKLRMNRHFEQIVELKRAGKVEEDPQGGL